MAGVNCSRQERSFTNNSWPNIHIFYALLTPFSKIAAIFLLLIWCSKTSFPLVSSILGFSSHQPPKRYRCESSTRFLESYLATPRSNERLTVHVYPCI
ncbi:hypothetical protein EJ08DRAFT_299572 [Tothia fuscella]|uniref:Uncharacterized protein n=1 Tax=Tothia fuscella TaxID=1048955 RepID=A0A9P4NNW8_9PEZI|nr:hypothetical protein EJ08DRAFT_299572 [Tothia fuscella]